MLAYMHIMRERESGLHAYVCVRVSSHTYRAFEVQRKRCKNEGGDTYKKSFDCKYWDVIYGSVPLEWEGREESL